MTAFEIAFDELGIRYEGHLRELLDLAPRKNADAEGFHGFSLTESLDPEWGFKHRFSRLDPAWRSRSGTDPLWRAKRFDLQRDSSGREFSSPDRLEDHAIWLLRNLSGEHGPRSRDWPFASITTDGGKRTPTSSIASAWTSIYEFHEIGAFSWHLHDPQKIWCSLRPGGTQHEKLEAAEMFDARHERFLRARRIAMGKRLPPNSRANNASIHDLRAS